MKARLGPWIDARWPIRSFWRALITEDIPGGASAFYSLGSAVIFVFILQAVTGICQLLFYAPTVDHAYASLAFFRTEIPFGWLIHNLHVWGATAMVVLVLLHMMRVFLWGAYKDPGQLMWLLGAFLLLLTLAMIFTGSPLPWDEKGYWATEVGTSIAGTVPVVGAFTRRLLRGGELMGQLTISRFYVLHTALLSGLLAGFVVLHLVALRRKGAGGAWAEDKRTRTGRFWPEQLANDVIVSSVVFLVLLGLATFLPPDFHGPADPMDASYVPKPEWSFLFLYQSLKHFPGSLEALGTVGVPLVLGLLILAVPFLDRKKERNPFRRPVAAGAYFAVLAVLILLSIAGAVSRPEGSGGAAPAPAIAAGRASSVAAGASQGAPGEGSPEVPAREIIGSRAHGRVLFDQFCRPCHGAEGKTGTPNPGSDDGSVPALNPIDREFFDPDPDLFAAKIETFIQNGSTPPGPGPSLKMPAFGASSSLSAPQIANIEAYVLGLNGVERARIRHPGAPPAAFFTAIAAAFAVSGLVLSGIGLRRRKRKNRTAGPAA